MKRFLLVLSVVLLALALTVPAIAVQGYSVVSARLILGESLGITIYTDAPLDEAAVGSFSLNGRTETVKPKLDSGMTSYTFRRIAPDEVGMTISFKAGSASYNFRYVDIVDLMLNTDGYDEDVYKLLSSLMYYVDASSWYQNGELDYWPDSENFREVMSYDAPSSTDKSSTAPISETVRLLSVGYYFSSYNMLRVVFTSDDVNNTRIQIGDNVFTANDFIKDDENIYHVYSAPIAAKNLDNMITAKLLYDGKTQTLTYSPQAYAYSVMNGDYSEEEQYLAWSLWQYAEAAKNFRGPEDPTTPYLEIVFDTDNYWADKRAGEEIFPGQGELCENAGPEGWGFVAYMYYPGSDEPVYIPESELAWGPQYAPDAVGPFDVTWTYTDDDNNTYTATVPFNVYEPGQILNTYALSRQAGLRGSINGVSLRKIVFCDVEVPDSSELATLANVGERLSNVYAFRYLGQEDTLYVTSGIPGKKVIHPGYGDAINTGYVLEVDCRGLDTSRLTTLSSSYPFWGNGAIFQNGVQKINYSGCDFSGLTSLNIAFNNMGALKYLDLSYCKFPNVTTMSHTFYYCRNLETIDLTGATFGPVTDFEYAFGTTKITTIDMSGFAPTDQLWRTQGMFIQCSNLESVDLSSLDFTNVTDAAYMFQEDRVLHTIVMPSSGMPNLRNTVRQMFDECRELQNVDLSGLNLSQVSEVFRFLYNCRKLRTILNIDAAQFSSSGYTFADMAIDDSADVVVNCTQASYEKLRNMIRVTNVQYNQHVTYNITD